MQVEPFPLKLMAPRVAGGFPPIAKSLERLWIGTNPAGDCGPLPVLAAVDAQYVPSTSGLHDGGSAVEGGEGGGAADAPGSCNGPEGGAIGGGGIADIAAP